MLLNFESWGGVLNFCAESKGLDSVLDILPNVIHNKISCLPNFNKDFV